MNKKSCKKRNRFIGLSFILLLIITVIIFIDHRKQNNSEVFIEAYEPPFTKNRELFFIKTNNDTIKRIDIEIADNNTKRAQGLMYRSKMADTEGMLFIFENEKPL